MLTVNFIAYVKYVLMYSTFIWNDVLLTEHFRWDGAKLSSICGWMDPACTRPAATIPMATKGKEIGLFCKIRLLVLDGYFYIPVWVLQLYMQYVIILYLTRQLIILHFKLRLKRQ